MFEDVGRQEDAQENHITGSADQTLDVKETVQRLVKHCAAYQTPSNRKAVTQLINTLIPFAMICGVMLYCFSSMYWVTALLTPIASLLLVRVFIIQHDCGHGAFFSSRKWNNRIGRVLSVLTWTPYDFWRKTHNLHHASSGNLDNRGFGAIETITIKEYEALDDKLKFWYRIYRNPYILLLLGTPFFILVSQRMPSAKPLPFCETKKSVNPKQIIKSVMGLNTTLLIVYGALGAVFGILPILLMYLPIVVGTAWVGGWLFFIQHQFEDAHWEKQDDWDYHEAAVMGSSYYDLPSVLQWLTGNIGLHHIHHLNAKVPNYRLQECMDDCEELSRLNRIKFWESLKYAHLALWDEEAKKMVRFS